MTDKLSLYAAAFYSCAHSERVGARGILFLATILDLLCRILASLCSVPQFGNRNQVGPSAQSFALRLENPPFLSSCILPISHSINVRIISLLSCMLSLLGCMISFFY
jgi:hypothetical protein